MAESAATPATAPVVIVGGGFGGLYTALALAGRRQHPPVLLIEPNDRFLFLPLLYELLSGELRSWEIAPRYDTLLAGKGVAWLQDRVERIDADASLVHTAGGRQLPYCRLVVATGAKSNSFGIPGVADHTLGFRTLADVERLQRLISDLRQRAKPLQRLAVVGAGASGVELACKLADQLQGSAILELIEQGPGLLPQAKAFNREQADRALQRRDVRLRTHTRVEAVQPGMLELHGPGGAEQLSVEAVIWTAGLRFSAPAITPAAAIDRGGRLMCTPSLQLRDQERIFALGDIGHVDDHTQDESTKPLPATAQVAFQQADCLAGNLLNSLAGEPLEPFQYNDLGEMMSLGEGEASLTGGGFTLAGAAAFQIRKLAYLARMPGKTHQLKVAAGWLADWQR
ncbi:MAG: FAD-dependent oxidoreductase [Cyanobium sp.]